MPVTVSSDVPLPRYRPVTYLEPPASISPRPAGRIWYVETPDMDADASRSVVSGDNESTKKPSGPPERAAKRVVCSGRGFGIRVTRRSLSGRQFWLFSDRWYPAGS